MLPRTLPAILETVRPKRKKETEMYTHAYTHIYTYTRTRFLPATVTSSALHGFQDMPFDLFMDTRVTHNVAARARTRTFCQVHRELREFGPVIRALHAPYRRSIFRSFSLDAVAPRLYKFRSRSRATSATASLSASAKSPFQALRDLSPTIVL